MQENLRQGQTTKERAVRAPMPMHLWHNDDTKRSRSSKDVSVSVGIFFQALPDRRNLVFGALRELYHELLHTLAGSTHAG